jgi:hypothetical protein
MRRVLVRASPTPSGCGQNFGIRVLGVDDHEVLVEGLKAGFEVDGAIGLVGHFLRPIG